LKDNYKRATTHTRAEIDIKVLLLLERDLGAGYVFLRKLNCEKL
jgi:hypothetical protein